MEELNFGDLEGIKKQERKNWDLGFSSHGQDRKRPRKREPGPGDTPDSTETLLVLPRVFASFSPQQRFSSALPSPFAL